MTDAAAVPLERAQKLAGFASVLAMVAVIIILVTTLLDVLAPVLRDVLAPLLRGEGGLSFDAAGLNRLIRILGANLISAGPNLLLAGAVGELFKVLKEYEKGHFFTLKAALGLRMTGEWALWALAFKLLLAPTLLGYVTGAGRGFVINLETFDLGLVAFALFVMLMGRVQEAAAHIKREHDEIV